MAIVDAGGAHRGLVEVTRVAVVASAEVGADAVAAEAAGEPSPEA